MSEDYTYEQPAMIAVRSADLDALRQRVQELETALHAQCELAAELMRQRTELERENANSRAKLDAVPVEAINQLAKDAIDDAWSRKALKAVRAWLKTQAVQP